MEVDPTTTHAQPTRPRLGRISALVVACLLLGVVGFVLVASVAIGRDHVPTSVRRAQSARRTLSELELVLCIRLAERGELPASLDDLSETELDRVALWRGVKDPWGAGFEYRCVGPRSFELRSLGADGVVGGDGQDADIILRHE